MYKLETAPRRGTAAMRFHASSSRPESLPSGVTWVESIGLPIGRCFNYDRLSAAIQGQGSGLERQQGLADQWCQANGLTLDEELVLDDVGRSAFHRAHLKRGAFGKFLRLAEQRRLGLCPALLIENLDRVSRFEPMDALQEAIFALLKADVTIITLQPGSFEVYEKDNVDMMKLIRLVVELEKSHKYSVALSERMKSAWEKTREKLKDGVIERPTHICPPWCDWDEDGKRFTLNPERVAVVQRLVELFKENGQRATAHVLNEEGHRTFGRWRHGKTSGGKSWSSGSVRDVIFNDALWGAATLHQSGSFGPTKSYDSKFDQEIRLYHSRRSKAARFAGTAETVEGIFPALYSREEVEELRLLTELRSDRDKSQHVPSNETMRWFGSRRTYCACGALMQWCHGRTLWRDQDGISHPELNPHEKVIDKRGKVYTKRYYLSCTTRQRYKAGDPRRCGHKFMPMVATSAHVLNRLSREALGALIGQAHRSDSKSLEPQLEAARQRVAQQEEAVNTMAANLESMLMRTTDERILAPLLKRQGELLDALDAERKVYEGIKLEALRRTAPPQLEEANEALQQLRDALVDWSSTSEQRHRVNKVLRDLEIEIYLNGNEQLVGLQVAGGSIDWQPLNAKASLPANKLGYLEAAAEKAEELEVVLRVV